MVPLEGESDTTSSNSSSASVASASVTSSNQQLGSSRYGLMSREDKDSSPKSECDDPTIDLTTCEPVSSGIKLKKELGLINGIAIIVGTIIGSGIFVSPRGVLQEVKSVGLSLLVWFSCGCLTTIGALCYSELGTAIPKSGGDYAYIKEAFGPLPAFLFLWGALFVTLPTANVVAALTLANYVLQPLYPDCDPPENAVRLIAALAVCILTFINCYSVKWATFVQDAFTLAKVFALVIIIVAGLYHLAKGNVSHFEDPWQGSQTSPGHIALSFYSGLFSYSGWTYLNFVTEELRDPYRNLPRAIYISLPAVTIIYALANIAYFAVLTPMEVLSSSAVAVTFGNRILGRMSWMMPLSVACSTFGGLNGGIFASSRLYFVGARSGHLPSFLAMINLRYITPMPSIIFLGLICCGYLTTTKVYLLINYMAFVDSLFVTFSVSSLLWLRYKRPDMRRPIKVSIALPIVFLVVGSFLVLLPFFVSPKESIIGAAITLSGIPVYFLTVHWESKPSIYRKIVSSFTQALQKLLLSVPEEKY